MTTIHAPWTATFADGPAAGDNHNRQFTVGPPWLDIWLIPTPFTSLAWAIVGGPGFPPNEPPWPGQAHYTLRAIRTEHGEQIAVYHHEPDD
ncbi:MAG: hypothetical protein ABSB73_09680 [Solirubrobacteraceae bacterium]|jgi:hypothetical protein